MLKQSQVSRGKEMSYKYYAYTQILRIYANTHIKVDCQSNGNDEIHKKI